MKILAIETATEACSAALHIDGESIQRYVVEPQAHSRLILDMMDDLLKEAELTPMMLDCLAFGRGPGSFTGVRIASSVIQGVAFAADLPVCPVSTLQVLAGEALAKEPGSQVMAAIDARMKEVYWAAYRADEQGLPVAITEEAVIKPLDIALPDHPQWLGAGSAWKVYEQELGGLGCFDKTLPELLPGAAMAARLAARPGAERVAAELATPVYLRDQVAQKSAARKQA